MQILVEHRVVRFLEHGHVVHAGLGHHDVLVLGEGIDLDADGGEKRLDAAHHVGDVLGRGDTGGFAGQEQDVLQAVLIDGKGFGISLVHGEMRTLLLVLRVETAVAAVVGAHIGDIKGRKEIHGAAEITGRELVGAAGHSLEVRGRGRGKQGQKVARGKDFLVESVRDVAGGHGRHIFFALFPVLGLPEFGKGFHAGLLAQEPGERRRGGSALFLGAHPAEPGEKRLAAGPDSHSEGAGHGHGVAG